ncbi:Uncharacterised protein [Zhongshania aliphaticivorans]|uniref:Thioesterase domain-containing protein n=1 Tax=Zhongshania aliphaticivorans TaxID=1470434 RepID=A0A5S9N1L1_9GAMM|nr:PaaI family thioesterase [Zhongshania aliphaticivorans]CAA0081721.1 Uncharacterised protein [Zhongshania aliphaticivorans]CAA0084696.1 Uncharacterised protein [Zhongshania aliphaticivorans]
MRDIKEIIDELNRDQLPFLIMLGAKVISLDPERQSCKMEFNVSTDLCHSVDVIQGGFVTAMLDAVMSHGLIGLSEDIVNVSSLEIKTTYLEPSRAGKIIAEGKIIKTGYKLAFMEGRLYNAEGDLTATASTVGKLARKSV